MQWAVTQNQQQLYRTWTAGVPRVGFTIQDRSTCTAVVIGALFATVIAASASYILATAVLAVSVTLLIDNETLFHCCNVALAFVLWTAIRSSALFVGLFGSDQNTFLLEQQLYTTADFLDLTDRFVFLETTSKETITRYLKGAAHLDRIQEVLEWCHGELGELSSKWRGATRQAISDLTDPKVCPTGQRAVDAHFILLREAPYFTYRLAEQGNLRADIQRNTQQERLLEEVKAIQALQQAYLHPFEQANHLALTPFNSSDLRSLFPQGFDDEPRYSYESPIIPYLFDATPIVHTCPITKRPITTPVVDRHCERHIFEKSAIFPWVQKFHTSPFTKKHLDKNDLVELKKTKLNLRLEHHERQLREYLQAKERGEAERYRTFYCNKAVCPLGHHLAKDKRDPPRALILTEASIKGSRHIINTLEKDIPLFRKFISSTLDNIKNDPKLIAQLAPPKPPIIPWLLLDPTISIEDAWRARLQRTALRYSAQYLLDDELSEDLVEEYSLPMQRRDSSLLETNQNSDLDIHNAVRKVALTLPHRESQLQAQLKHHNDLMNLARYRGF